MPRSEYAAPMSADLRSPPVPGPVVVRPMEAHEADRVGVITLAGYDAYGHMQGGYRTFLGDPAARVDGCTALLVADLGGHVVGTVTYVLPGDAQWEGRPVDDGDAGFRVLAVAPQAEGHGVGRALVEACVERSRARHRRRMIITSMSWMTRAHRLYEGLGFTRRPDLAVRFPNGDGVVFTYDLVPDAADHFPAPGPVPATPPWFEDAWAR